MNQNQPTKDSTKPSTDVQVFDPQTTHWVLVQRQCEAFLKSGFLPNTVKTVAQAVTIAWKGHELGMPPLYSFSMIVMINGTPCLRPEAMLALTYQKIKGAKVSFKTPIDKQNVECVVEMQRPDGEPQQFRFTIEDAKRAGLVRSGSGWEKYPAAYLRARVIGAGCRATFPDAIMGCYTPEEMGGDLNVVDVQVQTSVPTPNKGHTVLQSPVTTAQINEALKKTGSVEVKPPAKNETFPFEEPPPLGDFATPPQDDFLGLSDAQEPPETKPMSKVFEGSHNSKTNEWAKAKPGWEHEKCTDAQLRRLHVIGKDRGFGHEDIKALIDDKFGKESTTELTKAEIQLLFLELEKVSK